MRLRRIEGQVRGVQRMLEEGRPCSEVLVQLAAMREALNKVGVTMIAAHMESCLREWETEGPDATEAGTRGGAGAGERSRRSARLKEAVDMFLKFS